MPALFRFKCTSCGEVSDLPANSACPKCNTPHPVADHGYVQIYRMGSPIGIAVGYGVYVNETPYGHLANKESVRVLLPYGTYKFHFTCGMTRKCEDVTVTISPEAPVAYVKAHIVPGFWTNKIVAELATAADMPSV